MTRLLILQILLFFEWTRLSRGYDASEEPSHDKFILHIPLPITTLKHTHAVFRITENGGKTHHDLEIYQPQQQDLYTHQFKGSANHDRKRGSKKGSRQQSGPKNNPKQLKKEKRTHEKATEQVFQNLNSGLINPKKQLDSEEETRNEELFNRYFGTARDTNNAFKFFGPRNHKDQVRGPEHGSKLRGRAGRSQISNHYQSHQNHQIEDHERKGGNPLVRKRIKSAHQRKKHKDLGKLSLNHHLQDFNSGHADHSHESGTKAQTGETNLSHFQFEGTSFKGDPASTLSTAAPHDAFRTKLPKLHPNWADDGLISPFALNALFKDKRYNKKVFKELGWYPLFLPYEVVEDQERRR